LSLDSVLLVLGAIALVAVAYLTDHWKAIRRARQRGAAPPSLFEPASIYRGRLRVPPALVGLVVALALDIFLIPRMSYGLALLISVSVGSIVGGLVRLLRHRSR
jgi:hypothetical protein